MRSRRYISSRFRGQNIGQKIGQQCRQQIHIKLLEQQRNAMKILVQSLDLISFKKYLCSFVSQGKACCTLNILCRFLMYYKGLQSSGILLGFISKLIFLHLHLLSLYVSSKSFSGCLRIPGKLSSFSLQVLSDY